MNSGSALLLCLLATSLLITTTAGCSVQNSYAYLLVHGHICAFYIPSCRGTCRADFRFDVRLGTISSTEASKLCSSDDLYCCKVDLSSATPTIYTPFACTPDENYAPSAWFYTNMNDYRIRLLEPTQCSCPPCHSQRLRSGTLNSNTCKRVYDIASNPAPWYYYGDMQYSD